MNVFHANEFIAVLPDGLKDKTVNIFSLTDEGPSDLGVVVARDKLGKGEDLDAYAARQFQAVSQRLPIYRLLKREDLKIDGQPAMSMDCTWQGPEGKMFQRQVLIHAKPAGVVLAISATTRGDRFEARWEAMFKEFLENFRLRQ
ncbi:MAG: DUF1795 domain-containing protein [Polyangiaceae bacterium]|nr:DUF1795 domain-containing protein [Polyangiaceae bacterium]